MTPFAVALKEAKAEFDAWDATGRTVAFQVGSRVYVKRYKDRILVCACGSKAYRRGLCNTCRSKERSTKYPPCACGKPYFARDICRSCYYKIVNRSRRRERPKVHGHCACGSLATRLCGLCGKCYRRQLPKSPKKNLARNLRNLMRRMENEALKKEIAAQQAERRHLKLVPLCGFEPQLTDPKSAVLPIKLKRIKFPVMDLNHDLWLQKPRSCR